MAKRPNLYGEGMRILSESIDMGRPKVVIDHEAGRHVIKGCPDGCPYAKGPDPSSKAITSGASNPFYSSEMSNTKQETEMKATTTPKAAHEQRYTRGRNAGNVKCLECGRLTWKDRADNQCGLCEECFTKAGLENEHSDGHHADGCPDGCPMKEETKQTCAHKLAAADVSGPHKGFSKCVRCGEYPSEQAKIQHETTTSTTKEETTMATKTTKTTKSQPKSESADDILEANRQLYAQTEEQPKEHTHRYGVVTGTCVTCGEPNPNRTANQEATAETDGKWDSNAAPAKTAKQPKLKGAAKINAIQANLQTASEAFAEAIVTPAPVETATPEPTPVEAPSVEDAPEAKKSGKAKGKATAKAAEAPATAPAARGMYASIIGKVYGPLTVVSDAEPKVYPGGQAHRRVNVRCDKGHEFIAAPGHLGRKVTTCPTCDAATAKEAK